MTFERDCQRRRVQYHWIEERIGKRRTLPITAKGSSFQSNVRLQRKALSIRQKVARFEQSLCDLRIVVRVVFGDDHGDCRNGRLAREYMVSLESISSSIRYLLT